MKMTRHANNRLSGLSAVQMNLTALKAIEAIFVLWEQYEKDAHVKN
jgi:hypothetical protein